MRSGAESVFGIRSTAKGCHSLALGWTIRGANVVLLYFYEGAAASRVTLDFGSFVVWFGPVLFLEAIALVLNLIGGRSTDPGIARREWLHGLGLAAAPLGLVVFMVAASWFA
jgi:hypothetical protein